jgi:isoleucyl-tRNA synthetase
MDEAVAESCFNFPREEEATLAYWRKIDAFRTSVALSSDKPHYTFYDGPPFATGLPHYGHILAGTIKDTVTRYAHQTGHHVSRRFGWDCHGLPVEYEIDKALGLSSREEVLAMGIGTYNSHCRSIVQRYTTEWEIVVTRLGRWIDFENDYRTMDANFMESVWWVFKTLFDKGLVYRGYKVMPYSTACATPLSNFEAGLNYKDVTDPAVIVSFPLLDEPDTSLVAWTTTPWTLPSNLALCVNEQLTYVKVRSIAENNVYIVAEARLMQLFPALRSKKLKTDSKAKIFEVLQFLPGTELVGRKYRPLFDCYNTAERQNSAFKVISDAYVSSDAGTGIVHQAPAFGEDDYRVCLEHGIIDVKKSGESGDLPCPVDANGRFTLPMSADLLGVHVKNADAAICATLKGKGRLVLKEAHEHSYPFCWRSDTPLIYKAVPSWFVAVESLKDKLIKNNAQTYWVPDSVKVKRFHNWLADAKDWAISRNRFWGTPIPLWISKDSTEMVAIGSIEELHLDALYRMDLIFPLTLVTYIARTLTTWYFHRQHVLELF